MQSAIYDVMRFWFDRGVDGFGIDVLWHLLKAADFPNNPPNPAYQPAMGEMHRLLQIHSTDQIEVHSIAAEMRAIADGYGAQWLKANHDKPVTLEEYLGARAQMRKSDSRQHLAGIYSVAKNRNTYVNLKTKFGFFQ